MDNTVSQNHSVTNIRAQLLQASIKMVHAAAFVCAAYAQIFNMRPFGTALLIASIAAGGGVLEALMFFGSAALFDPSISNLSACFMPVLAVILARLTMYGRPLSQKQLRNRVVLPLAVIALVTECYRLALDGEVVLRIFLSVFLSAMSAYVFALFLMPLLVNKLRTKLLSHELAAGGIVVAVLSLGMGALPVPFPLVSYFGALAILCASFVSPATALAVGICIGVGMGLPTFDTGYIALFGLYALFVCIFRGASRVLAGIGGVVAWTLYIFYFDSYVAESYLFVMGIVAAAVTYALVPRRLLDVFRSRWSAEHTKLGARQIINRNRLETARTLGGAGRVFGEMQHMMSEFAALGGVTPGMQRDRILSEVTNAVCTNCPRRPDCAQNRAEQHLATLIERNLAKDRLTVLDIPEDLVEACCQIPHIISLVGESVSRVRANMVVSAHEDLARQIVAEQLGGVARILGDMSEQSARLIGFDIERERALIEELSYHGITVSEALLADSRNIGVTLIVRNDTLDPDSLTRVVSRYLRSPMQISAIDDAALAGWSVVTLEPRPRYDVIFATSSLPRDGISGDTHCFVKISRSKFLMALCDGMGTGREAERMSAMAVQLVENFYKAGFDSALVLDAVNRFLGISGSESYAALDIGIIDLDTSVMDIIKIGSPQSLIKSQETTEVIEGGALPLGVLDEMRPFVARRTLVSRDMVVFVTDGVADVYQDSELAVLINNTATANPQVLASAIMQDALARLRKAPRDDMSVAVARIFENI